MRSQFLTARYIDIPVPQEVIDRQHKIRDARKKTAVMFRVSEKPYNLDTPEYAYFCQLMFSA